MERKIDQILKEFYNNEQGIKETKTKILNLIEKAWNPMNENFRILTFLDRRKDENVKAEMAIPGINLGSYEAKLYVSVRKEKRVKMKGFFSIFGKIKTEISYVFFTITEEGVRELRNECNKILTLKIKKESYENSSN